MHDDPPLLVLHGHLGQARIGAATFAVSIVTLALLRVPYEPAPREGFWAELAGGWAEMRRHR